MTIFRHFDQGGKGFLEFNSFIEAFSDHNDLGGVRGADKRFSLSEAARSVDQAQYAQILQDAVDRYELWGVECRTITLQMPQGTRNCLHGIQTREVGSKPS